jgi:hypothetical protein
MNRKESLGTIAAAVTTLGSLSTLSAEAKASQPAPKSARELAWLFGNLHAKKTTAAPNLECPQHTITTGIEADAMKKYLSKVNAFKGVTVPTSISVGAVLVAVAAALPNVALAVAVLGAFAAGDYDQLVASGFVSKVTDITLNMDDAQLVDWLKRIGPTHRALLAVQGVWDAGGPALGYSLAVVQHNASAGTKGWTVNRSTIGLGCPQSA